MTANRRQNFRPEEDEDAPLVERTLGGDQQAYEQLVRKHEQRVFRTAIAILGELADAEEAMQEAFLKAYQNLPTFRRDARFTTWLTRIAVNESLQILRRRRDAASLDDLEAPLQDLRPSRVEEWYANPERRYATAELKRIVEEAIRALPPAYRVVFLLRDVEELSTEETAEALGLSIPATKSRVLRARLMVREALAAHFEKPPTLRSRLRRATSMVRNMMAMAFERPAGRLGGR
ncbi:MAG: sigma-70 family RNA polymerase sigma factor [Acidobacteriia bacterium]|nr:sigma-70 family RNA polymerase sigma factor [Terriglobia bacterium]